MIFSNANGRREDWNWESDGLLEDRIRKTKSAADSPANLLMCANGIAALTFSEVPVASGH